MAEIPRKAFISYRREGGSELARLVRDQLAERGHRVFMDVEDLRSGPFNKALYKEIESATDFIVILTSGCLDRCDAPNDWMRLEIACAIGMNKNIIPVIRRGFAWPEKPLPEPIKTLPRYQGIEPSHDYFSASMDKLSMLLGGSPNARRAAQRRMRVRIGAACLAVLGFCAAGGTLWWLADLMVATPPVDRAVNVKSASSGRTKGSGAPAMSASATPNPSPIHHKPGESYTEDLGSSVTLEMAWIPSGKFQMGNPAFGANPNDGRAGPARQGQGQRRGRRGGGRGPRGGDLSAHPVELTGFWMGRYEITIKQFARFAETTGYETTAQKLGSAWSASVNGPELTNGLSWQRSGFRVGDKFPVVCVSWDDCVAFADWASRVTGGKYRLPSEAQWEYAARAGVATNYPWGDNPKEGDGWANGADQSLKRRWPAVAYTLFDWDDGWSFTCPVGSFKANPFGLFDVIGNAAEWCADWQDPDYYKSSPLQNPAGPATGEDRVYRGASWATRMPFTQVYFRGGASPDTAQNDIGFRIVAMPE